MSIDIAPPPPETGIEPPAATPAEQETLVRHLAEHARGLHAGDSPERAVIRQRFPGKVLQLGVLPALPTPDPTTGETPEELARKLNHAPSAMSLDFLVERPAGGTPTLETHAAFSVYLQRYPDRGEQERFHTGGRAAPDDQDDGDDGGANGDGEDGGGTSGGGDAGGHGGGPRNMRLYNLFERFDISSERITVTLTGERGEDELDLHDAVLAGVGARSGQTYAQALTDADTVYPFWGARGQVLPAAALDGDDAHYRAAIRAAEGGSRAEPLAVQDVVAHVSWQPDDSGHVRVKVSLQHRTLEPRRERPQRRAAGGDANANGHGSRRQLVRDLELFNCRLRVYRNAGEFTRTRFLQSPKDFRYRELRWVWCTGVNCVGRRLDAGEDAEEPLAPRPGRCTARRACSRGGVHAPAAPTTWTHVRGARRPGSAA